MTGRMRHQAEDYDNTWARDRSAIGGLLSLRDIRYTGHGATRGLRAVRSVSIMMFSQAPGTPPGLAARRAAADLLEGVLHRNRPFDEHFDGGHAQASLRTLSERDRALTRRIVATSLRKLGTLRKLIGDCLNQGLREKVTAVFGLESALITGAAQLLFLGIPDHAAVDLSVRLVQGDRSSARFAGVVNAVLRRIARNGTERLAQLEPMCLDTPAMVIGSVGQNLWGGYRARHRRSQRPRTAA